MDCQYLPLDATGQFSTLFLDYLARKNSLQPFYGRPPALASFGQQIREKSFSDEHRQTLVRVLERQYANVANAPDIQRLANPNTFTVTTGHQLNLFTGPLFVMYKLVTTINLARQLRETYPDYDFVPVYWMASEDHDLAEIDHFRLFGQTYRWQTEQRGAVGRMDPRSIADVLAKIPAKLPLFEEAYTKNKTLADAVRHYVHGLFGSEGLVCLDADDAELKQLFAPVMRDELLHQRSGHLVQEQSEKLQARGYNPVITARELNLFYLTDGVRERIERTSDGTYNVVHTKWAFTEEQVLRLLDEHPERFSPNVVLRPLYQEVILPNLAYVGGPSEVPYWLQLKSVFDHYSVPFPMLLPRNFALYVPPVTAKRMKKLGFALDEWFQDVVKLKQRYVEQHTRHALRFDKENKTLNQVLGAIQEKALRVDPTLERAVLAETKRFANAIANLEKKLRRAEERNQATGVQQLLAVRDELFPAGQPQERTENFLTFWLNDRDFLRKLLATFDPFDFRLHVCLPNGKESAT